MTFKIVYHFMGDDGILREIKWLNNEKYEWQWIKFGENVKKFEVVQCQDCLRIFKDGTFKFDSEEGRLSFSGITYILKRIK